MHETGDVEAISRRTILAMTGAAATLSAGPLAAQQAGPAAQQPAREKGPRVWLDLDQKELDDAYDQSKYAPNQPQVIKRYGTNSEAMRARIGAPKRFAYGTTAVEGFDLYATSKPNAPVNIFV